MLNDLIRKYCYKVTFIDRRPFGEVTMRFWEPKNIVGRIHSLIMVAINLRKIRKENRAEIRR